MSCLKCLPLVLVATIVILMLSSASSSLLKVGFYTSTCPHAEKIVADVVEEAIVANPGIAAGLIRMHFHDCFVRGCDASILLDSLPGAPAEKDSPANNPSLRGFEVINEAKAKLESICPSTVSCADIIAFAARDSAAKVGGIMYQVLSGRRDGTSSTESEISENLPSPFVGLQEIRENFAKKGMSQEDMVTLSGAHSIGRSHCSSFSRRLYSFNSTTPQDPSLNASFAEILKTKCPPKGNVNGTVEMDMESPNQLDNIYYTNLIKAKGLFTSDQTLMGDSSTAMMVANNSNNRVEWAAKFAAAMVKMGSIEVITGDQGEIRNNCSRVYYNSTICHVVILLSM